MFSSLRSRICCCRLQQKLWLVLQHVIDVRSEYCTQSPLHRHLSLPVCLWVSCSHQCRVLTLRCCGTTRMIVYIGLWRNYWRESLIGQRHCGNSYIVCSFRLFSSGVSLVYVLLTCYIDVITLCCFEQRSRFAAPTTRVAMVAVMMMVTGCW